MIVTHWPNVRGRERRELELDWPQFVEALRDIGEHPKQVAPLVKLASFGEHRTSSGSLRHDANVLQVYGLEGDYDEGRVSVAEAVRRLEAHNLRAVVVTTHSHQPQTPRWRVYAPLKGPIEPQKRSEYVAALNGALGGILAVESFKLSQSFYVGRPPKQDYELRVTFDDDAEGYCLDEVDETERSSWAVWPPQHVLERNLSAPSFTTDELPDLVEDMLASIDAQPHDDWVRIGAALHRCDAAAGLEIWDRWSATASNYCGREEIERRWASFDAERPNAAGAGTIVALAKAAGYDGPVYSERERALQTEALGVSLDSFSLDETRELPMFVSLEELAKNPELLQPPKEIVPRLAWKGRTTGLVGGDKSGKSTLMGYAVASVTNGASFLQRACQVGRVLIVAPDEAVGDTVQRLLRWGADPTKVRLLTMQPQKILDYIRDEMDKYPPDLLIIDSLAEWARLAEGRAPEDGDAAGWGSVIRPLVQLSRDYNCATVLLHHSRRSDGQYRGSGEIAAALDCLIEMRPGGAEEDPTTRKFSGRARWSIEPFEVRMVNDEYVMADDHVLTLETKILMDLRVAGPSSRNAQLKRIGGRKDTYLTTVYELLERGELFEKDGLLHHGAEKANVN